MRPGARARQTANRSWLGLMLLFGMSALYLTTLSQNLSITHDSIQHLLDATANAPRLHGNHILYSPMLHAVLTLGRPLSQAFGLIIADHLLIEGMGALAGGLTLWFGYQILTLRLAAAPVTAALAMVTAGLTYAIWYYSVAIEIYIFPLMMLTASYLVASKAERPPVATIGAALLHSLAILLHQTSVFFIPSALVLLFAYARPGRRWRDVLLYAAIGIVTVSIAYFVAFRLSQPHAFGVSFGTWLIGHGNADHYWSPASPMALVYAAVSYARAFVSAHFVFGMPLFEGALKTAFEANNLEEEQFLVREFSEAQGLLLLGLSGLIAMAKVTMVVTAIAVLVRGNYQSPSASLLALLLWIVTYAAFFIAWDSKNVDFWLPQTFILVLLLGALLPDSALGERSAQKTFALLAFGLFIVNGFGVVLPARDPDNDYHHARLAPVHQQMTAHDLLVIGDSWPSARHITYGSDVDLIALSSIEKDADLAALLSEVQARLTEGRRVFLNADVFTPHSASLSHYGQTYQERLQAFTSAVCGREQLPTPQPPGMQLFEVTCLTTGNRRL